MISTKIEINAPPSIVREILLSFSNLSSWHTDILLSCKPLNSSKSGLDLVKGDKIKTQLNTMTVIQEITENSNERFTTIGPWLGLLTGKHTYSFIPHPTNQNITLFEQEEEFSGILSFMMNNENWLGGFRCKIAFEKVNNDLKVKAEEVWKERNL